MLIFDFTGIYENEGFDFYKENNPRSLLFENENKQIINAGTQYCIVSLKDISGTNCICDEYAEEKIRDRIRTAINNTNGSRIRIFDSGNYHYMTKLLMDSMCEDGLTESYDLIMFDHHPDMKWTSYGEILSCGSWVLNAMKDRKELGTIFLIGAEHKLIDEVFTEHPEIKDRVCFMDNIDKLPIEKIKGNVYISIDKDVLSREDIITNWDQGNMTLHDFKNSLELIRDSFKEKILAVDVCGECSPDSDELFTEKGIQSSNDINSMIVQIFENLI